jgi:hypothetical protein
MVFAKSAIKTTPDPSAGSGEDSLGGATQNTISYTLNLSGLRPGLIVILNEVKNLNIPTK